MANENLEKYKRAESQLRIDEHDLDGEAMAQPQRFNDAAKEAARAEARLEAAKDHLKTVEAEVEIELRGQAERKGEKATDKSIAAQVLVHQRRKDAFEEYLAAKLQAAKWDGLKEAFKDRSFMIRELSGLWLAGYFQDTSTKGAVRQVEEAQYNERKRALSDERNRRRGLRVRET